jgi:PAS domain S-box-containing protein
MTFFRNIPIKRKLTAVVMLTTGTALFLSCAVLFAYELYTYRKTLERDMASMSEVIGAESTVAVAFDDRPVTQEILAALKGEPQVVVACIYRPDGARLAEYVRNGAKADFPAAPGPDGYRLTRDSLVRVGPIFEQNDSTRLGTIYLRSDFHAMHERLASYAALLGLALIASALVAFALSARLQRYISEPVLRLAGATRRVSGGRDYSIRVPKQSNDELGELIDGFNQMLEQIQVRDAALQSAHDKLEQRVRDRTRELEQEVAERRRAQQDLDRSLSLTNATLESTADGIFVVDHEGKIVGFNQKFLQMWRIPKSAIATGEDRQSLVAMMIENLRDPEAVVKRVREIYAQPEAESFETLEFKDGRIIERFSQPQRIGGVCVGRVWSFRDVTERMRAGERIREQANLLDLATDAIIVCDVADRIVFWNKSAERIYGWSAAEAIGNRLGDLVQTNPVQFLEAKKAVSGKGEWIGELQKRDRAGREIVVEGRWTLLRDEHGAPKSILSIDTDITERKKLEAQFLRAQRMESIGTLAGGIAHDLNNVLSPIMVSIQLLQETCADETGRELLGTIEASARRGADLVKQVLYFGRGVEGQRIPLHPKHLIRDVQKIIGDTFPKSIHARNSIAAGLWMVHGDVTQLHQVLLNLCVNARDAMPDGGVLSVKAENIVLDEQFAATRQGAKPGPHVLLTVSDTGSGIPADIRDKIFDPFFTTKEIGKGTGLGLATALGIVKSHGGFMTFESEEARGTTFQVYLPASMNAESASVAVREPEPPMGAGELVLVVDDEPAVRTMTQRLLETAGYRVATAADGTEATAIYVQRKNEIAAVLTDMMMPVMDGVATIRALKHLNPGVRIIAATGMMTEGHVAKAVQAGANFLLRKPCTAAELLKIVRQAIDGEAAEKHPPAMAA